MTTPDAKQLLRELAERGLLPPRVVVDLFDELQTTHERQLKLLALLRRWILATTDGPETRALLRETEALFEQMAPGWKEQVAKREQV